jgi:hypothetical protein
MRIIAFHFPEILVKKDGKALAFLFLGEYYELEAENDLGRAEKEWEDWEISFLIYRFNSNLKYRDFAKALGRSDNEIRKKVYELSIIPSVDSKDAIKYRVKCALKYKQNAIYNRILNEHELGRAKKSPAFIILSTEEVMEE